MEVVAESEPSEETGSLKRADAIRNREAIIKAAFEVLGEAGVDAQMSDIAKAAGLGIATVYRNFPSKEAVVHALVADRLSRALAALDVVESRAMPAWEALNRLVRSIVDYQLQNRVLSQFLSGRIAGSPELQDQKDAVYAKYRQLIRRAQADGDMRKDVGVSDIRTIMVSVAHLATGDTPLVRQLVLRHLQIIMDGLRAPGPTKLQGQPLTMDQWEQAENDRGARDTVFHKRGRRSWPTS